MKKQLEQNSEKKKHEYIAYGVKGGLGTMFIVFLIELLRRPVIIVMFLKKIFGW